MSFDRNKTKKGLVLNAGKVIIMSTMKEGKTLAQEMRE